MSDWCFPFKTPPELHWRGGSRFFGAPRPKGRKHGGCDLIKPPYEQIYAVHDGVLVHEETLFYQGTFYVTYQHGPYLVRYGEILKGSTNGAKRGHTVKKGDPICKVGLMINPKTKKLYPADGPRGHMLHLEMYAKGADHSTLRSKKGPYQRRKDVMDPAPFLDEWVKYPPPG
jgi:murein DD-endopeptidase MepM/ murein hydrolase activator NlpD